MSKGLLSAVVAVTIAMGVAFLMPSRALAGTLDQNPALAAFYYNDGLGPYGGAWSDSTTFSNVDGLSGYVDWAVFSAGAFPFSGFTPTPGELTYVYQIFVTGEPPVSSLTVARILGNPANNIGSFSDIGGGITGDAPTSSTLNPGGANWTFTDIQQGTSSEGLAYNSIRVPQNYFGSVVNTGSSAPVIPLPTPDGASIPEPATFSMLALVCGISMLRGRRA